MTTNHRLEEAMIFCALRTRKYISNGGTVSRRGTLGGSWTWCVRRQPRRARERVRAGRRVSEGRSAYLAALMPLPMNRQGPAGRRKSVGGVLVMRARSARGDFARPAGLMDEGGMGSRSSAERTVWTLCARFARCLARLVGALSPATAEHRTAGSGER